ncbi:DnaJ domain-containing protein [uncultured Thalassospira sp.]|uniref:DnaJ domain-containing protein n=1 Tax=uncultured Thalassospira sp. TaxID=404382 RepID=UPI00259869DE|nr:DnaJ domain-containing protein [uncultured Thalassospira sp.]|tara:strand:+ start:2707 stop:4080 length:1374 start_codon:yes stop_codon:yes gene_type:complete
MNKDRLGIYYSMLNIAPGASAKEIKLAYRKLAFEYHPDRNTDLDAEEKFKDITEAYEILIGERKPPAQPSGNNTGRPNDGTKGKTAASEKPTASGYGPNAAGAQNANRTRQGFAGTGRKQEKAKTGTDEKTARANQAYREQQAKTGTRKSNIHPGARRHNRKKTDSNAQGFIACAATGVVSAQPRQVEFKIVRGFLNSCKTETLTANLAPKGAKRMALKASFITWLRGFWGWRSIVPAWKAILGNMRGGTFPPEGNAKMLFAHANAFERAGNKPLARAVLMQALDFIGTNRSVLAEQIRASLRRLEDGSPTRRVRDEWKRAGMLDALLHLSPLFVLIFAGLLAFGPGQGFVTREIPELVAKQGSQITKQVKQLIGEDRDPYYVDRELLNMRDGPSVNNKIIRRLTRFETVYIAGDSQGFWIEVETTIGENGFVNLDALVPGNGSTARDNWCATNKCD